MKIVFLDAGTLGDVSFAPIEKLGELVSYANSTAEEALERVKDCDVMIVNKVKVTPELMDAAKNLKLVCEAATGVNNIDMEYAASKGIPVKNVAGYSTESVVQSTFMHILSLVGRLPYYDARVKSGRYSWSGMFTDVSEPFFELDGKTIGIIGMGTIGRRVARVAEAFGMKVIYYSTSGTSHCTDWPSVPLERLMSGSDVVSVHAPLNERTAGLVGTEELALMKPSAVIVNMGRGGIVDEAALALTQAIKDLRKIPDRDALNDLIAQVEGMDLSDYTADSVQALNASVHAAKQVLDDPEATPQQVAGAYDDVEEKVGQLETKKHDGSHSGGSSGGSSSGST